MAIVRTKITSKGQVTVPVEVRRQLDLQPGDELVFEFRDQELCVRGLKRRKLSELRGTLPATRPFPGRDAIREEVGRSLGDRHVTGAETAGEDEAARS
jgi:antitoxin PrlF